MERMNGADALMLYLDRAACYNHTIKLSIIDPGDDPDGWSWKRFKGAFGSRVGLVPMLRKRYLRVPFGLNHPVWVDDPEFDLDYHLKRVACPAPGTMVELCEVVSELYAHPLDHSRPLWQMWAIEGLEGGRVCVALFIHHALTDGIGILRMLNAIWKQRPEAVEYPNPEDWHPAPLPSKWRLLIDGLAELPRTIGANLPGAIRGMRAGRRILAQWRREGKTLPPAPADTSYPAPFALRISPRRSLAARSFALPRIKAVGKALGVTINDVFLATVSGAVRRLLIEQQGAPPAGPLMHTAGLANSVPFQMLGGRCVTMPNKNFDPKELLRAVARERVFCMIIVGDAFARPMLAALEEAKAAGETIDLSCLKLIISSGVIWSQAVKEKMLEWVDATLFDGVGATEGAMALQISRRGQTGAGASFVALADTRLFTEDGRDIPKDSNEPGMIAAGGDLLPAGYYKDPEKTAKTFRRVGGKRYAFIGDWGQWNPDGTLRLLGRGSACINTGGEKVYPEEVEQVLAAHPNVADCLVIGMPDERFGQKVVALVAPQRAEPGLAASLAEFVQGKMAGYKRPRAFLEVDKVPRMANGKADYKAAKLLAEKAAATR